MLTARDIANILLRYIGIYTMDPSASLNATNQLAMTTSDLDDVLKCINGGLQEVYIESTLDEIGQRLSSPLYAPVSLAAVTTYSTSTAFSNQVTIATGFYPWMLGCSININGDQRDNQFVSGGGILQSSLGSITGGSGYTSAPTLSFPGGDGNAAGFATVSGGAVTAITMTCTGNGYLPGNVVFTGGGGTSAACAFTPSTTFNLLRPYMGAASTTGAFVWCDAVAQPANIARLVGPVAIPNIPSLHHASTEEQFNGYHWAPIGWAANSQSGACNSYTTVNKPTGQPCVWFADKQQGVLPYQAPQLYLRLSPKPGYAIPITYGVRYKPYQVQSADIFNPSAPTVDPWAATGQSFPLNVLESVLLQICLKRWKSNPHFSASAETSAEIDENYKVARQVIIPSQKASVGPTHCVYADAAYAGTFEGLPYGRSQ